MFRETEVVVWGCYVTLTLCPRAMVLHQNQNSYIFLTFNPNLNTAVEMEK